MHYFILVLNLAFIAFIVFFSFSILFSILSTKYHLRKTARKLSRMHLSSRNLSSEEVAACQKVYPQKKHRIQDLASVVTINGPYIYTTLRDRWGRETRYNPSIGVLPIHFLQSMESSLKEDDLNILEVIVLSDGTVLPVSINDSWTVQKEAAAQDALERGERSIPTSEDSKLSNYNESPSNKEYWFYHPPLGIITALILLIGVIILLCWEKGSSDLLLAFGAVLTIWAFFCLLFSRSGRAVNKINRVSLSGTIVFRGDRVIVDRFLLQIPPKGKEALEEGQKMLLEGWVHPKNHVTFYTTAIRNQFNETKWSIEENHWSRKWMRFILPLIILILSCLIYIDVNNSFSIAEDYWNWKKHGQTVQTFTSVEQLEELLKEPGSFPPGSIINLGNFAIVDDVNRSTTQHAYRVMEKGASKNTDFSEARMRAKRLVRLIRTPLATSIFVRMNYPDYRLPYIALFIEHYTSDEQPEDFADAYSESVHYSSFLKAAAAFEATPNSANAEKLFHPWSAFINEEIEAINKLITIEFSKILSNQKGILITSDYNAPRASCSLPATYFREGHFNPYAIRNSQIDPFPLEPKENWIADPPFYEAAFDELEQLYRVFPAVAGNGHTALVTGMSASKNGDPVLDLTFSLSRVEQAQSEWEKMKILFALVGITIILSLNMIGDIVREGMKLYRR